MRAGRRAGFYAVAMALTAGGFGVAARPAAEDIAERARKLHARAIVVDTHIDTTMRLLSEADFDFGRRDTRGHVDLVRLREGNLNAPFFSIYIPATITGPEAVKRALRLIDTVRETVGRFPKDMELVTSAEEVRRAHRAGRIGALMGMEGGHMIDDDLGVLRMYAALGVRYLTLAHGRHTNWADSSGEEPKHGGLTEFGREVVRELNRQGVMVDISHVSDQTFWHALEVSRAPLIASHSSCRALSDHPRNMSDEMIRAMAEKGGVIQITFVDAFLSQPLRDYQESTRIGREAKLAEIDRLYADDAERRRAERQRVQREYREGAPKASWELIVEHIDHAVKLAGVDHVGIGSDFDGATMPEGMEDASQLPKITEALLRRGYSDANIEKILGGNLLRVMEQAERVARDMAAGK